MMQLEQAISTGLETGHVDTETSEQMPVEWKRLRMQRAPIMTEMLRRILAEQSQIRCMEQDRVNAVMDTLSEIRSFPSLRKYLDADAVIFMDARAQLVVDVDSKKCHMIYTASLELRTLAPYARLATYRIAAPYEIPAHRAHISHYFLWPNIVQALEKCEKAVGDEVRDLLRAAFTN